MQARIGDRLQEVHEGVLILMAQPTTAQRQAGLQLSHHPELRLASLWAQSIQTQEQPALLRQLVQLLPILSLMTGQQGQIVVLIEIAHL